MSNTALAPCCLVVTRPQPEAQRWVDALQAQAQPARALPLTRIASQPLTAQQCPQPGQHAAWMFVSGAAVRHFFAQLPADRQPGPQTRFWCTGPGTAAALREVGVPAERIDSPPLAAQQFDSEALWAMVQAQLKPGMRVCIVRGGDAEGRAAGRPWLAHALADAGVQVDTVVAYRRLPPLWDEAALAALRAAVTPRHVWLFSSSEAVQQLREALQSRPALPWADIRALATHARIADAVRTLGVTQLQIVAPLLDSVLAALQAPRT